MSQTNALLKTLKKALRTHGYTYADVATRLGLTEASIKRLFSEQSFSLSRLDRVCQMMDMELSDLIMLMNQEQNRLKQLSEEQEQEITADLGLLLVTVCVLNKWTIEEIIDSFKLTEPECIKKLAKLDKLKIIELLPNNRIKLLVATNFSWLENGPIQSFFQQKIAQEFVHSRFKEKEECLFVLNGMLSAQSNGEFQSKLQRLCREFSDMNNHDASLPVSDRNGVTIVMAMRGWNYGLFAPLGRSK